MRYRSAMAPGRRRPPHYSELLNSARAMAERYLISKEVPETLKAKFERTAVLEKEKSQAIIAKAQERKERRRALMSRTLKFNKEYMHTERTLIAARRQAKAAGNFFVEPEPKLLFVVRIAGINKLSPKPRKILQLLRLRQIHNGVFLKVNKPIINLLKCVQPYITYGYPSLKTVRELVYKRGYGKVNGNRIPLSSNEIIVEKLGKYGICGIEDMVHELYTAGPNFKQVSNFLWPFKLSAPRGGYVYKRHGFNEPKGGDWGNRMEQINELVSRMN